MVQKLHIGTSQEAYDLAVRYGLFELQYRLSTLEWVFLKLRYYYDLPDLPITTRKLNWRKYGHFRQRFVLGGVSLRSGYEPLDIVLDSVRGMTLGTLIHEFAHFFQFHQIGYTNHKGPWQRLNVSILRTFVDETIVSRSDIDSQEALERLYELFPSAYQKAFDDLLAQNGQVKSKDLLVALSPLREAILEQ